MPNSLLRCLGSARSEAKCASNRGRPWGSDRSVSWDVSKAGKSHLSKVSAPVLSMAHTLVTKAFFQDLNWAASRGSASTFTTIDLYACAPRLPKTTSPIQPHGYGNSDDFRHYHAPARIRRVWRVTKNPTAILNHWNRHLNTGHVWPGIHATTDEVWDSV